MQMQQRRTDVKSGNPILDRIEMEAWRRRHKASLRNIKSSIDNAPPLTVPHLSEGRNTIAKKKKMMENAQQDLKMIRNIVGTMTRSNTLLPNTSSTKSLNAPARRKELFRITHENHQLLGRLEGTSSQIRMDKFEQEYQRKKAYVINSSYSARKNNFYSGSMYNSRFGGAGANSSQALVPVNEENRAVSSAELNAATELKTASGGPSPAEAQHKQLLQTTQESGGNNTTQEPQQFTQSFCTSIETDDAEYDDEEFET